MTDEVKTVAEKISSWAQILITELCSMKSHTEKNMQNIKNHTDHLYIFITDWADLTSVTSADIAVSTSTVLTSFSPQESVDYTSSLFIKQFMVTMRTNWFFKCWLLNLSMFEEKRVKFRPWLQQINAKLNVNMSDNTVSIQFWYIHSQLEGLTLSQVTSWIVACIKSHLELWLVSSQMKF